MKIVKQNQHHQMALQDLKLKIHGLSLKMSKIMICQFKFLDCQEFILMKKIY